MNYILGVGINGIILKLYDKGNNFKIIGDKIGGQILSNFQLGPRILKSDIYSDKFVNKFLDKEKKEYKVGYYYDDKVNDNNTQYYRNLYFKKTRGGDKKFEESSMNDNVNKMIGYDINYSDIQTLNNSMNIIQEHIEYIDLNNKIIYTNKEKYFYNKIINTLPINVFYKLCNINKKVEYNSIYFYKVNKHYYPIDDDCDFIYIPEEKYCPHRITKIDQDYYCVEVMSQNNNPVSFDFDWEDSFVLKDGHLKEDDVVVEEINNIKHCGRYAQCDHSIRMHDVIKYSMERFK